MTRGRTSKILSPADRRRLRQFQSEHSRRLRVPIGLPQLKLSMEAPFSWETLQRALAGKPIWESYHEFIVAFLDRARPAPQSRPGHGVCTYKTPHREIDYKSRASGEREDPETEGAVSKAARSVDQEAGEDAAVPTHRGSR